MDILIWIIIMVGIMLIILKIQKRYYQCNDDIHEEIMKYNNKINSIIDSSNDSKVKETHDKLVQVCIYKDYDPAYEPTDKELSDEDLDWLNIRADAYKFVRDRDLNLIKNWLSIIGAHDITVGYYVDTYHKCIEIYSTTPGKLIGLHGKNVDILKEMMSNIYHSEYTVKFTEIKGGFIHVE